jgi:hypothetical protein
MEHGSYWDKSKQKSEQKIDDERSEALKASA